MMVSAFDFNETVTPRSYPDLQFLQQNSSHIIGFSMFCVVTCLYVWLMTVTFSSNIERSSDFLDGTDYVTRRVIQIRKGLGVRTP